MFWWKIRLFSFFFYSMDVDKIHCYATVWYKNCTIQPACVRLCEFVGLVWRCLGVCWHLPAPTVRWLAVCTVSHLTLCWLQLGPNAHLTPSLLLWCNPVEVISFTGLSTSASGGEEEGGGGWEAVCLCLISLPQTIPLNKISYDDQWKGLSTEDWIKHINGLVTHF